MSNVWVNIAFFIKLMEKKFFVWEYMPLNTSFVQKWTAMIFLVGKPQKIKMAPRNLEFLVLATIEQFLFNIVQFLWFSVPYLRRVLKMLMYLSFVIVCSCYKIWKLLPSALSIFCFLLVVWSVFVVGSKFSFCIFRLTDHYRHWKTNKV